MSGPRKRAEGSPPDPPPLNPAEPLPGLRLPGEGCRVEETTVAFAGRVFSVLAKRIVLPNGHRTVHEVIHHRGAVSIVPLVEETPGRPEVVLVEQFRSSVEGFMHEIPAGTLDAGEDPLHCARRELREETGYVAERWTHLATIYPTPGIAAERMHYYLAEGLRLEGPPRPDPAECLTVKKVPLEGLLRSLCGERVPGVPTIVDGKTYVGVLCLWARRELLAGKGPG